MNIKKNEKGFYIVDGKLVFCQIEKQTHFSMGSQNKFGFVDIFQLIDCIDEVGNGDVEVKFKEGNVEYGTPEIKYFKNEAEAKAFIEKVTNVIGFYSSYYLCCSYSGQHFLNNKI